MARRNADQVRRAQLARIHILKAELGLDRDQYEAVLWTIGRVDTAKELDSHGRLSVINHLVAQKARQGVPQDLRGDKDRPAQVDKRPQLPKIEMLLLSGGHPWQYALAIAKRMYGKDRMEFCTDEELSGIIAALAQRARRQGRRG